VEEKFDTTSLSSANFVGCVVGLPQRIFLFASGASSLSPRYPLKGKWYWGGIGIKKGGLVIQTAF
jgi:hypothetical protein